MDANIAVSTIIKMKAVAITSDRNLLDVTASFCREAGSISLEKKFTDPAAGLRYLNKYPADLLFIDIDMPAINGLELYGRIQQDVLVIFITGFREYAVESFNLSAVDYLVKPFTFERFMQAARQAEKFFGMKRLGERAAAGKIYLRADNSLVKIEVTKITHIEALDDYLKIHIADQKMRVVRMTMKSMLEKLPANRFIRTHRSFIVAVDKIRRTSYKAIVVNGQEIPVSNAFAKSVQTAFLK